MTRAELRLRMSAQEFVEWQAYFMVESWLSERLQKGESPQQALEYARTMHAILERTGR